MAGTRSMRRSMRRQAAAEARLKRRLMDETMAEFGAALAASRLRVRLRYAWLAVTRAKRGGYARAGLALAAVLALAAYGLGSLVAGAIW